MGGEWWGRVGEGLALSFFLAYMKRGVSLAALKYIQHTEGDALSNGVEGVEEEGLFHLHPNQKAMWNECGYFFLRVEGGGRLASM